MELVEYIKWRGDLTFDERPLNEVDSLLFCTFAYEKFDDILNSSSQMTIQQLGNAFFEKYDEESLKKRMTLSNRSYEIVKAMKDAIRYKDLVVSDYVNEVDRNSDLQLSAITFSYQNKWKYIAFRGTDHHIVGWKEDFIMLYKEEILAQRKAVEYLQKVIKPQSFWQKLLQPSMTYYLGGHSKGGNLAMYAASELPLSLQKSLIRIDNFDGPGFKEHVWQKRGMQNILNKIHTYLPTSSFFGRLFDHHEQIHIIQSNNKGLMQHAVFGWLVDIEKIKAGEVLSEGSNKANERINEILNELNDEEKEQFVKSIFMIFERLEIYKIADMVNLNPSKIMKGLLEIKNLDSKYRKIVVEVLMLIVGL